MVSRSDGWGVVGVVARTALLPSWGQKTATSCKCLWLQDFSHRALLGFRPPPFALPARKGHTQRITGV